ACYRRAAPLDDAYGLMSHDESRGHGILALEDVQVRPADGGRGDPEERVVGADLRHLPFLQLDAPRLDEYGGLHCLRHGKTLLPAIYRLDTLLCGRSLESAEDELLHLDDGVERDR